jgi:hypothetical protein
MTGKFWISAIVMVVMTFLLSFVVHGVLLHSDYMKMLSWMRKPEDAQALMVWMFIAHAVFGVAFAWVYLQGREDKPWLAQGTRYGIAVACLAVVPIYLIYHVVTLVPLDVAFKQIAFDTVRVVLMGIVLAWINRGVATRHA